MQSHPGKDLKEHLREVTAIGLLIFDTKDNIYTKDEQIRRVLEIALSTHDYGKGTKYFQEYLKDQNKYRKKYSESLKAHAYFSALITYYFIERELKDEEKAIIGAYIVLRHHGFLENMKDDIFSRNCNEKNDLNDQLESFDFQYFDLENEKQEIQDFIEKGVRYELFDSVSEFIEKIEDEEDMDTYILINYLFSILISADKGSAIYNSENLSIKKLKERVGERIVLEGNLVDQYKKKKFKNESKPIDLIRENIYREAENEILKKSTRKIFSLNVPTGSGKTLTVFNAALKLREQLGNKYKIIYNLPFTSVIDQNFAVFEDILGEKGKDSRVLLKHHYLAQKEYKCSQESLTYNLSEYYIENWDSEIIVTTFAQFFQTLFSNQNRKLKKYHALSNSIIILDEIQSVPHEYWKLINNFLKILTDKYNCYIILVTATMPLIFDEYKGEIIELVKKKEEYFKEFERITLDKTMTKDPIRLDDFLKILKIDMEKEKKSTLIIMNTINSSLKVYEYLKKNFSERKIYYLSTNIIPRERMKRIEEINNSLKKGEKVLLVSTQLIEAGVDIDLEVVYRDYSTLDSINQTCGRCNRNGIGKNKGTVKLYRLRDDNKEYSKYIYEDCLLTQTEKALDGFPDIIDESSFFELSRKYFQLVTKGQSKDKSNEYLDDIKKLKYEEVNKFSLIKKEYETIDIFIEIDEKAKNLYQKYKEIMNEEDKFKRKEKFDKIKSDFLSYVISVPSKCYPNGKEGINYVDNDTLLTCYDRETGFIRDEKMGEICF